MTDWVRVGEGSGFGGDLQDFERFGSSVASIGDLDGDGVTDLVIGAELDSSQGTSVGAVWILLMNADGTAKSERRISSGDGGIVLDPGAHFGSSVDDVGDLDGDGLTEIAVGAEWASEGASAAGAVWILFPNADGSVRVAQQIANGKGAFTGTLFDFDAFGCGVDGIGDLDGDGIPDLAVGSESRDHPGASSSGSVWILFLTPQGTVKSSVEIGQGLGGFGGTLISTEFFGSDVGSLGDVDGDGVTDIAVGSRLYDSQFARRGAVWILFMNPDGTVKSELRITNGEGGFGGTLNDGDELGSSLALLPDLDGNGSPELAVGAPGEMSMSPGGLWILFLKADGSVEDEVLISGGRGGFDGSLANTARFGGAVDWIGDLDSDGDTQLIVGSPVWSSSDPPGITGTTFLFSLCESDVVADYSATPVAGENPLVVTFTDQSSGADLSSWSWDFGDGSGSSLQSPTKTYALPGTYTVRLTVFGGGGSCGNEKANLIVVSAAPASVTKRNGSGINPDVFDSQTLPVLGTTWTATVDAGSIGVGGLSFLFGYDRALTGLPTSFGELLIDPFGSFAGSHVAAITGGLAQHQLAVPNDLALEGLPIYMQVLLGSSAQLTNALDLVLGL